KEKMTQATKPLVLHGTLRGPNPFKVAIILRELNLPYTVNPLGLADVKKPAYTSINPNGRIPALHDPNTNITVWESGAIIEYLAATYDKERTLSFEPGTAEHWHSIQWLHFQVSGQGPYFGQASWFLNHHPEKLPSAIERYENEMKRVCSVLEGWLAGTLGAAEGSGAQGKGKERQYLVGDKCSFADLAFIPWHSHVDKAIGRGAFGGGVEQAKDFPYMHAWMERIRGREGAKEVSALNAAEWAEWAKQ
ncbi:glutathione S-transferase, partial [Blastomyces parvus]